MATLGFQMKTQQTNDATLELKQVTRLAFRNLPKNARQTSTKTIYLVTLKGGIITKKPTWFGGIITTFPHVLGKIL